MFDNLQAMGRLIRTLRSLETPINNKRKNPKTNTPLINHLAGNPFADVEVSFDSQESSKNGTDEMKTKRIKGRNKKTSPNNSNHTCAE
jgi:hypothetical protein